MSKKDILELLDILRDTAKALIDTSDRLESWAKRIDKETRKDEQGQREGRKL